MYGLSESVSLLLPSGVEKFATFDEKKSTFRVDGKSLTRNDFGIWEITVEVTYLGDPLNRIFKTKFMLHVQDEKEEKPDEDEKPEENEKPEEDEKLDEDEKPEEDEPIVNLNLNGFEGLVISEPPKEA